MKRLVSLGLALCLVACGSGEDLSLSSKASSTQTAPKAGEFAFTPKEFVQAFNNAARIYGKPFYMNAADIRHGAVHDYFQQIFDTGISITASVSKDTGYITTITALVRRDGSQADRDIVFSLSKIVTAATNPNLSREKITDMVNAMLQESSPSSDAKIFPQRFINHVRYALRNDSGVGYWWIANPI